MDRGEVQVAATMRRWGIQVQKQTAEKQTPHQSGQCGADTFHEARQMIRKEAPSVVGAKEEQGYGASGGGYVSPCVGEEDAGQPFCYSFFRRGPSSRPDKHMDNRDVVFGVLLLLLVDKLHASLAPSGSSSKSIQHERLILRCFQPQVRCWTRDWVPVLEPKYFITPRAQSLKSLLFV